MVLILNLIYPLVSTYNSFVPQTETERGCPYDYVEIRDGATSDSPLLRGKLCGTQPPKPNEFHSTGTSLYVLMHSDSSTNTNRGFSAAFKGNSRFIYFKLQGTFPFHS